MGSPGPRSDIRVLAEIHNKPITPFTLPGATQPPVPPSHVGPPRPRLHLHPQDITIEMCRLEAVSHFEYEVQSSASRHDHRQHTPVKRIAPHRPQMTHRGWCRHWLPRARSRDAIRSAGEDGGAGEGHRVGLPTLAASGPDLGPGRAALGPGAAAEPRKSTVSIPTGGGTEARCWEAAQEGGG